MIYLDNASTTQILPDVFDAMIPYLRDRYGNPGTIYTLGREAKKAVDVSRERVASLIGADPSQVIFTSGGSESNSTVFSVLPELLAASGKLNERIHVIYGANEHDSVLKSAEKLCEKPQFYGCVVLPDWNTGCIDGEAVNNAIAVRENVTNALASFMYINNETGCENDVNEIGTLCSKYGILFHTDCVQALGAKEINVKNIGCDFASFSSHKIHGPKGVGAIFVKNPEYMFSMVNGGGRQEYGLRGGTENVAGIVGFGMACEIARTRFYKNNVKTSSLKGSFYFSLMKELENLGLADILHVNGNPPSDSGRILNVRFDRIDAETLVLLLDKKGIAISAGSACNSLESQPSHVLVSMGLSDEEARSSVRISFSELNTEKEVVTAAKTMAECVKTLRM